MNYISSLISSIGNNRKSGLVVGIVSVPLSISLGIASGATPLQGLITAIWSAIIASIFASSKHNIFGPAGALSGLLLGFSLTYGAHYLPIVSLISGCIMAIIYVLKIGKYISLIPAAGLQGFLFVVGLTILSSQLANGLGLVLPTTEKVYETLYLVIINSTHSNIYAVIVFVSGLIFLWKSPKIIPRIPGIIILTLIGIGLGYVIKFGPFTHLHDIRVLSDTYTISFHAIDGIRKSPLWGQISSGGITSRTHSHYGFLKDLFLFSFIIAVISVIETNIAGKIAEKKTKVPFSKDREILGNAMVNIGSGLFGGLPASAVLIRTSLNIDAGANNKRSQAWAGIVLLAISSLLFTNAFSYLPFPIIASILVFTAIRIMDFTTLSTYYTMKKESFVIVLITIIVSLIFDSVIGIITGTIISLLLFIGRITKPKLLVTVMRNQNFFGKFLLSEYQKKCVPGDLVLIKLRGELNYLNSDSHIKTIMHIADKQTMIVLCCDGLMDIDIDGIEALDDLIDECNKGRIDLYITGLSQGIYKIFSSLPGFAVFEQSQRIYASNTHLIDDKIDNFHFCPSNN